MGMYTDAIIQCKIPSTPTVEEKIIPALKQMLGHEETGVSPTGPIADCTRHAHMLRGRSYYYFQKSICTLEFNKIFSAWLFFASFDTRNYEKEIEKFLEWLAPYTAVDHAPIAFVRYEEASVPDIYYRHKDGLVLRKAGLNVLEASEDRPIPGVRFLGVQVFLSDSSRSARTFNELYEAARGVRIDNERLSERHGIVMSRAELVVLADSVGEPRSDQIREFLSST